MKEIGKCVGDMCRREYRGGTFGKNRRTKLVYLFSTNINGNVLVATDRKLRGMHQENQELHQQLQEARNNGGNSSGAIMIPKGRSSWQRLSADLPRPLGTP